jgi:copper oxidase (laccase) domain-containing protein
MTSSTSLRSCADPTRPLRLGNSPVVALWSGRADGDQRELGVKSLPGEVPHQLIIRRLDQVHGAGVLSIGSAGSTSPCGRWEDAGTDRPRADALVASDSSFCLVVLTADCVPVALGSDEGLFGVVHVGWRGLALGVIENALDAMRAMGASEIQAGIGPSIHPCCYAFERPEADLLEARYGPKVRSSTKFGEPALDLPLATREALGRKGASVSVDVDICTACDLDFFSHRARKDTERQALFVWSEKGPG